ncbi:MAG TPA: hypothetical protein QF353_02880 [Gammaproteobacteria bacterium]|nr:hypothetical protein [Gammaproteobacteria bacterium]
MIRVFEEVLIVLGVGINYIIWVPIIIELLSTNRTMNFVDTVSTGVFLIPTSSFLGFYSINRWVNSFFDHVFPTAIDKSSDIALENLSIVQRLGKIIYQTRQFVFDYLKTYFFMTLYVLLIVMSIYVSYFKSFSFSLICLIIGHSIMGLNYFGLISNSYKENVLFNALMWVQVLSILKSKTWLRFSMTLFISLNELQVVFLRVNKSLRSIYRVVGNYVRWLISLFYLVFYLSIYSLSYVISTLCSKYAKVLSGDISAEIEWTEGLLVEVVLLRLDCMNFLSPYYSKNCPEIIQKGLSYVFLLIRYLEVVTWVFALNILDFTLKMIWNDLIVFTYEQISIFYSTFDWSAVLDNVKEKISSSQVVKYAYLIHVYLRSILYYIQRSYQSFKPFHNKCPRGLLEDIEQIEYEVDNFVIVGYIHDNIAKLSQEIACDFPQKLLDESIEHFKHILQNRNLEKDWQHYLKAEIGDRDKKPIDLDSISEEFKAKLKVTNLTNTESFTARFNYLLMLLNKIREKDDEKFYFGFRAILVKLIWCPPAVYSEINYSIRSILSGSVSDRINEAMFHHREVYFNQITGRKLVSDRSLKDIDTYFNQFFDMPAGGDKPLFIKNIINLLDNYIDKHQIVSFSNLLTAAPQSSDYVYKRLSDTYDNIMTWGEKVSFDEGFKEDTFKIFNLVNYYNACISTVILTFPMKTLDHDFHEAQLAKISLGLDLGVLKETYFEQWINVDALKNTRTYPALHLSYQAQTSVDDLLLCLREQFPKNDEILDVLGQGGKHISTNGNAIIRDKDEMVEILKKQLRRCENIEGLHYNVEDLNYYVIAYLCRDKTRFILEMLKIEHEENPLLEGVESIQCLQSEGPSTLFTDNPNLRDAYFLLESAKTALAKKTYQLSQSNESNWQLIKEVKTIEREIKRLNQKHQCDTHDFSIKKALLLEGIKKFSDIYDLAQRLVPIIWLLHNGVIRPKSFNEVAFKENISISDSIFSVLDTLKKAIVEPCVIIISSILYEHRRLVVEVFSIPLVQRLISIGLIASVAIVSLYNLTPGNFLAYQLVSLFVVQESLYQAYQCDSFLERVQCFFWHPKPFFLLTAKIKAYLNKNKKDLVGWTPDWSDLGSLALCAFPPIKSASIASRVMTNCIRPMVPFFWIKYPPEAPQGKR